MAAMSRRLVREARRNGAGEDLRVEPDLSLAWEQDAYARWLKPYREDGPRALAPGLGVVTLDLEVLARGLHEQILRRGMLVYPGVASSAGTPATRHVSWPDGDLDAYLDLAVRLEARLVYVASTLFDRGAVQRLLRTDDPEGFDDHAVWADVVGHLDRLEFLGLTWMHDGVAHDWFAEADWRRGLLAQLNQARAEQRRKVATQREMYARRLAQEPEFQHLSPRADKRSTALRLVPELSRLSAERQREVVGRAVVLYREEYKAPRERRIAQDAHARRRAGESKSQIAKRHGISPGVLSRIMRAHEAATVAP